MSESIDISKATKLLFNERENFIIIGLTGRTGSGCTTVANFLTQEFNDLPLPAPKENDFVNNEERKYKVIVKYAKTNWAKFELIQVKNIITSFILEYDFDCFLNYIKSNLKFLINDFEQLEQKLTSKIANLFNTLHALRLSIKESINKNRDEALKSDDAYQFYFNKLPEFTNTLQDTLAEHQSNLYILLYQNIGNNIRRSGQAFERKFEPDNIFKLPQRINVLIKILRKRNISEKGRVLIVIDAIRNPHEAIFFKERYSAFYLFSVNTENSARKDRLINLGLDKKQIEKLDKQEYPAKLANINKFTSQDIGRCIEISDVHLYNPTFIDNSVILKQIIRYVTLIMHPGLVTPTHIERCMQMAYNAKLNSGCLSRQVGAVITDSNFSIKSVGWNNVPESQIPCNLRDLKSLIKRDDRTAFSDFEYLNEDFYAYLNESCKNMLSEDRLGGRVCSYCFKDAYNAFESKKNQVHTRALHAEENAFLQITKYGGIGVKDGFLFTTASPCELCAKKAYQIGIKKIFYIDPYPGISEGHVLHCGNNRPEMNLFNGAIGRSYYNLYTPIIPYKDEINMLIGLEFGNKKQAVLKPIDDENVT